MPEIALRRVSRTQWSAVGLLAAAMVLASVVALIVGDADASLDYMSDRQVVGTLILYSLLPSYLIAGGFITNGKSVAVVDGSIEQRSADAVRTAATRPRANVYLGGALGALLGYTQNDFLLFALLAGETAMVHDVIFVGGMLVWTSVGFIVAWRLDVCALLWRFGRRVRVDLFDRNLGRRFGSVATANVGFVAGGVASMALQSLDAEFRWHNYEAGAYVGLASAALLFWLPLDGLRRNLVAEKERRLVAFQRTLAAMARDDVVRLEVALQHRDRIETAATVPVDVSVARRIVVSIVLPPLAWIAAAVVENWVDGL